MLNKICPCLGWLQKTPKKQNYQNQKQIQEQQFMNQLAQQASKSSIYDHGIRNKQTTIQQQFDHELNLQNSYQIQDNYKKQDKIQKLEKKVDQPKSNKYQQSQQLIELDLTPKFKLNIQKYSQYYSIISDASKNIDELLDNKIDCTQLQLLSNSSIQNKTKLRLWRKATNQNQRAFIFTYEIPCSYAFYAQIMNKSIKPENNDKYFLQSKLIESIYPNLCSKYVCMNKMNPIDRRQFSFLKYVNGSQNYHWQICINNDQVFYQNQNKAKSCPLHFVSLLIQNNEGGQSKLEIRSYLKTNIGVTVQNIWQYAQFLWNLATNNYEQQLV